MDEIPEAISKDLNFDMSCLLDEFLNIKIPVLEYKAGLGSASGESLFDLIFFSNDSGPRPPPPATALIIMAVFGPREEKNSLASSSETPGLFPGGWALQPGRPAHGPAPCHQKA